MVRWITSLEFTPTRKKYKHADSVIFRDDYICLIEIQVRTVTLAAPNADNVHSPIPAFAT